LANGFRKCARGRTWGRSDPTGLAWQGFLVDKVITADEALPAKPVL
jgi:hypothetical protein